MQPAILYHTYFEIVSSASLLLRGPNQPIDTITISILPAMNVNTPGTPKRKVRPPTPERDADHYGHETNLARGHAVRPIDK